MISIKVDAWSEGASERGRSRESRFLTFLPGGPTALLVAHLGAQVAHLGARSPSCSLIPRPVGHARKEPVYRENEFVDVNNLETLEHLGKVKFERTVND